MIVRHDLMLVCILASGLFLLSGVRLPARATGAVRVYWFSDSEGYLPKGPLVSDSSGNYYGTARGSGGGSGTVFKLSPTGEVSVLHTFSTLSSTNTNADGAYPTASLIWGNDGNLYGTAWLGGANGTGTVFRITPGGAFTVLHTFSALNNTTNADGAEPLAALTLGTDGNFYGVASAGGANGTGTIFKITPAGAFTTLYCFSALNSNYTNTDGAHPQAALVQGTDGIFYGVALDGGDITYGTVFKITPGGTFTNLHSFTGTDGKNPLGLVLGADGVIYGVTFSGNSGAVIFQITSGSAFAVWTTVPVGVSSRLTLGPDGNFYGGGHRTGAGESPGYGVVFQITPARKFSILFVSTDGFGPVTSITPYLNGTFLFTGEYELDRLSLLPIDFNADGHPDLIWQNESTGEVVYTLMEGLTPISWGDIFSSNDSNWKIVGVPDFWQYGSSGLLIQNVSTGEEIFDTLIGTSPGYLSIIFQKLDPRFRIVSTPDLNQDGYPDIIWENQVTGEVVYTLMSPSGPLAWGDLFKHIDPSWLIVGTPDLNGDGYPDVLFQNSVSGDVVYALMKGLTPVQWGTLFKGIDPNFQIAGTMDLNRDGYPDIIWQNRRTGEVVYTLMHGTTPMAWGDLFKSIDPQFKLVGMH